MTAPKWLRLSWWAVAIWFLPALVYFVYASAIESASTGVAAEAVSAQANEVYTIILYFGALPLVLWVGAAGAFAVRCFTLDVRPPRSVWIGGAVLITALLISRLPPTAWSAAAMRTGGPEKIGTALLSDAVAARDTARIAELLVRGVPIDSPSPSLCDHPCYGNETALMTAARTGDIQVMTFLLAHGANPNAGNTYNENALMRAIAAKSLPAVELLLAHGANVNAVTQYDARERQNSVMKIAEYVGDTAILRVLKKAAKP